MGISKNLIEAVVVCEKSSDSDSFILRNCNFIAMNFLAQINVDYPGRRPQAPACFKYDWISALSISEAKDSITCQ